MTISTVIKSLQPSLMILSIFACFLSITYLSHADDSYTASITAVYPTSFGVNGGALITITGNNFMRSQGTTDTTDGATNVFVANSLCEPVEYFMTDNMYVCKMPKSPLKGTLAGDVPLQMQLIGVLYGTLAICSTSVCKVSYSNAATPFVAAVDTSSLAYDVLSFDGYFCVGSIDQIDIRVGETLCVIDYDPTNATAGSSDQSWANDLTLSTTTNTMIKCRTQEQAAGRFNLTVTVSALPDQPSIKQSYGLASMPRWSWRVDDRSDALPYNFIQFPTIQSISPPIGGVGGGGYVTITGTSFDCLDDRVTVRLGDMEADLIDCSIDQLIVRPRSQTDYQTRSPASLTGQPGLTDTRLSSWGSSPSGASINQPKGFNGTGLAGARRLSGLFKAPYNGSYTFIIAGSDRGEVYISADRTPPTTTGTGAAWYNGGSDLWYRQDNQKSITYNLTAGEVRYISALYQGRFSLGARIRQSGYLQSDAETTPFLPTDNFYHKQKLSVPTIHTYTIAAQSVREVQTLYIQGVSGGKVALSTRTGMSPTFNVTGSTSVWSSAINALLPCSNIGVVFTYVVPNQPYYGLTVNVTFNCPTLVLRDALSILNVQFVTTAPANVNRSAVGVSFNSRQVVAPSIALTGTFRLQHGNGTIFYDKNTNNNDNWTPVLQLSASWQTVQSSLVALTGLDDVEVARSGNSQDSATFVVVFYSPNAAVPCMNIDSSLLRGDITTVSCAVTQQGTYDRQYTVLPSEWFFQPADQSLATVTVNGLQAFCAAGTSVSSCSYVYDQTLTPTISSVQPVTSALSGGQGVNGLQAGQTITVTGSGFTGDVDDVIVQFVPTFAVADDTTFPDCVTTVATTTSVECTLPHLTAGDYDVRVLIKSRGYNAVPYVPVTITYAFRVDSVFPLTSSMAGGQLVWVTGTGFRSLNSSSTNATLDADHVLIGGSECLVELASTSRMLCRAPINPSRDLQQAITIGSVANSTRSIVYSDSFFYDQSITPQVLTVSPKQVSAAMTTRITITGSGFVSINQTINQTEIDMNEHINNYFSVYDVNMFAEFSVRIGKRACNIQSVSSNEIICQLIRAAPENNYQADNAHLPKVYVRGKGYASVPDDQAVDISLMISSISRSVGSLAGGQYLTISGSGFANSSTTHVVVSILVNQTVEMFPNMLTANNLNSTFDNSSVLANSWTWAPLDVLCDVTSLTFNQIVCFTRSTGLSFANLTNINSIVGRTSVVINQIGSVCSTRDESDSCYYGFSKQTTPVLTVSSPSSGGAGDVLTITGSNLATYALDKVLIGHDECDVVGNITDTLITCTIRGATAATVPIQVLFSNVGWAIHSVSPLTFTHLLYINTMSVSEGSYAGGTVITLTGNGFSKVTADNAIVFRTATSDRTAVVLSSTNSELVLVSAAYSTPLSSSLSSATMRVTVTGYFYAQYNYPDITQWSPYVVTGDLNPPKVSVTSTQQVGSSDATFTYRQELTPSLTVVAPLNGRMGTQITISGSGFNTNMTQESMVLIGNADCEIMSWSNAQITCTVGATPGGKFAVNVYVANKGLAYVSSAAAALSTSFTSSVSISSIGPATGGYGGGTLVTVSGAGFSNKTSANSLLICNNYCAIKSASYDQITCLTESLATLDRIRALGPTSQTMMMGSVIANMGVSASVSALAFDMNTQTIVESRTVTNCWIGMDMGPVSFIVPTTIRWFAPYTKAATANGGRFEVANSLTGPWTVLATISNANEAWNEIYVLDTTQPTANVTNAWRYIRYAGPSSGCKMADIEFHGFNVSSVSQALPAIGFSNTASCPVTLQVNAPDLRFAPQFYNVSSQASVVVNSTDNFVYDLGLTPLVTSIEPNQGSSLGGTLVTITGTGFTDLANTVVELSGYPCIVENVNSTTIMCTTTARSTIGRSPTGRAILVTADKQVGDAVLAADTSLNTSPLVSVPILPFYRYVDRWSQLNTWLDNEPPMFNDTVVIPEGQVILMDVSPPLLFVLLVQGVLIWDRVDGLTLDATYIWVQGGTFQIGTEAQPFMQTATITMHGDRYITRELPHVGSKVLTVGGRGSMAMQMGNYMPFARYLADSNPAVSDNYDNIDGRGILDIHGIPRLRVWTKVAADSLAGSNTIVTSEDVDYKAGETIFITASSGNMWETEVVIVAGLADDKRTITLTEPLKYDHISGWHTFAGEQVDLRVEVALMSRNIKVQGDENSDRQQFGSHTMMTSGAVMRIENAEFTRCGQGANLGRYCIHWHLAGDAHESYAKSNSIHRSYQRATTVHGTQLVTVFNEVAYDVKGHTFFTEDGAERQNTWEQNLGVLTQPLYTMLSGDRKPATFWTSSPMNAWRSNVAAGCSHDGFWFELPGNPAGPSYSPTVCPSGSYLGQFFNNTAKNNGVHGLRIYPVYQPLKDACNPDSEPLDVYFYNFTSFHNGQNGIFGKRNGQIHHVNAKLLENGGAELSWVKYEDIMYNWDAALQNMLFVGSIDPTRTPGPNKVGLIMPQDEFFYVNGAKFVNYGSASAMVGCNDCDSAEFKAQGGYTYRLQGLQFINSASRTSFAIPQKEIFHDLDGSLTGFVNGTVTPPWPHNEGPGCTVHSGIEHSGGIVCDGSVRVRRMVVDFVTPNELYLVDLLVTNRVAGGNNVSSRILFRQKEEYGWVFPVVTARRFDLDFNSPIDWTKMFVMYSRPEYVRDLTAPEEFIRPRFKFIDYRYSYSVNYPAFHPYDGRGPITTMSSLIPYVNTSALTDNFLTTEHAIGTGALTYNNVTLQRAGTFELMINAVNATTDVAQWDNKFSMYITANQCPPEPIGCPKPPESKPPTDYVLWSANSTWASGAVPAYNTTVTIPANMYVMIDVPLIVVDQLNIEGKLEFLDGMDHELVATRIYVTGYFQAGNLPPAGSPFMNKITITLKGEREDPVLIATNDLFLGNKVMAVFGTVNFIGAPRKFVHTRLYSTVMPGSRSFTVSDPVDWQAGNDTISISSTEYNYEQIEDFNVTNVVLSSDGKRATVTVDRPFSYRHFAGVINHASSTVGGGYSRLAAVVALTSRNIVIRGDNNAKDATGFYGYGGSIVVSEATLWTPPAVGKFNVSFVEFRNMGKMQMSNPALLFQYYSSGNPSPAGLARYQTAPVASGTQQAIASSSINAVRGCSFTDSYNYGIVASGAPAVYLDSNIIHRPRRSGIKFDPYSTLAIVTNNIVMGLRRSPEDLPTFVRPISSFFMNVVPLAFTHNVAAGSEDAGFTLRLTPCGTGAQRMYANEAHGNLIGLYALPGARTSSCVDIYGFSVWKNAHVGVLTVDQTANLKLDQLVVSDNHIGVSLNFHRGDSTDGPVMLSNSVIMGSTEASTCDASVRCRASKDGDFHGWGPECNSVYRNAYRRVGLMTMAFLNGGKTCEINADGMNECDPPNTPTRQDCAMSWEKRYGLPSTSMMNGMMNATGVTFAFWNHTDCGLMSRALAWNPTQVDSTPMMNFRSTRWTNSSAEAKFSIRNTPATESCESTCDGRDQLAIRDEDGSLIGIGSSGTLVSNQAAMVAPPGICTFFDSWQAYSCENVVYRRLIFESMDRDRGSRRLGPVIMNKQASYANQSWATVGPMDDHCPIIMHFSWFPFLVEPGLYHDIVPSGSMADYARMTFHSEDPTEKILLSIFYTQPLALDLYMGSTKMPALGRHPTINDPIGSYQFDPQARRVYLVIGGAPSGTQFNLIHIQMVQITMQLAVDFGTYNGPRVVEYLAQLLSIDPSRIKVASVHSGSVVTTLQIFDAPSANSTDPNEFVASQQRLSALSSRLVESIANTTSPDGETLIAGYPVISLVVTPPRVNGTDQEAVAVVVSTSSFGLSTGAIIGIAVGAAVFAIVVILVCAILYVKKQRASRFDAATFKKVQALAGFGPPVKHVQNPTPSQDAVEMYKVKVAPRTPSPQQHRPAAVPPMLPSGRPSFTPSTELPLPQPPLPHTPPKTIATPSLAGFSPVMPSGSSDVAPPSPMRTGIHNDGGNPFKSSSGVASFIKQRNAALALPSLSSGPVTYEGETMTQ